MDISELLGLTELPDGTLRVTSRERRDLEFKQSFEEQQIKKCIKAIAAFANAGGGKIVFGVTDSPRIVCGVDISSIPDEAHLDDLVSSYLLPVPNLRIDESEIGGKWICVISVSPLPMPPTVAIKDLQMNQGGNNKHYLQKGCVYYRRSGKSQAAGAPEFLSIMEKRDKSIRESIIGIFSKASEIGFDNVAIADMSDANKIDSEANFYIPEETAKKLNIIDRGKLVESAGAPAYEIKGGVRLSALPQKDPRKPMLPEAAARALRPEVRKIFWPDFPWTERHLLAASKHLGHWDKEGGDQTNVSLDELTKRRKYFDRGRQAVLQFARTDPDTFVEIVGSKETRNKWESAKGNFEPD